MAQDYFASLVAPASQAQAEAGTDNIRPMTPLRTKQAAQQVSDAAGRFLQIPSAMPSSVRGLVRLKKLLRDVASGTRNHLTQMILGDSLASRVISHVVHDHIKHFFPVPTTVVSQPLLGLGTPSAGIGGSACVLFAGATATLVTKTDYTVAWDGSYFNIASGQYAQFSRNTVFGMGHVDKIIVPLIMESGAGSVRIEIDDGSLRDPLLGEVASGHSLTGSELIVDCDGSFGLEIIELEFSPALPSAMVRVTHESGGTVRLHGPQYLTTTLGGGCVNYFLMAQGSNNFEAVNPLVDPLMGQLIEAIQPDIISVQCDDSAVGTQKIIESIASALTTVTYKPLVIGIGNGPTVGSTMVDHNVAMAKECSKNNFGFFSMLDVAPTYADLVEAGWNGDGIHLTAEAYELSAIELAQKFGFHRQNGVSLDPTGLKQLSRLPAWPIEIKDTATLTTDVAGSATWTDSNSSWLFATGTTANSKLTRRHNDFSSPLVFRAPSYQQSYELPLQFAFACRLTVPNAEGQFWVVYGTNDWNLDAAQDLTEAGWAFKLENGTPILQLHDGTTLTEHSAGTSHHTGGVASSQTWKFYRILQLGGGKYAVYQDNVLVGVYSGGPTGFVSLGAAVRAAVSNGATAAGYSVQITPPVINQTY